MAEGLLLFGAFSCALVGMAFLALAMKPHWEQARREAPHGAGASRALRRLGALSLFASFVLCFSADHASMAALVWVMTQSLAAMSVAFLLAFRPRWLAWLAAWLRAPLPSPERSGH